MNLRVRLIMKQQNIFLFGNLLFFNAKRDEDQKVFYLELMLVVFFFNHREAPNVLMQVFSEIVFFLWLLLFSCLGRLVYYIANQIRSSLLPGIFYSYCNFCPLSLHNFFTYSQCSVLCYLHNWTYGLRILEPQRFWVFKQWFKAGIVQQKSNYFSF